MSQQHRTIFVGDPTNGDQWYIYTWTEPHPDGLIEHQVQAVYLLRSGTKQPVRVLWRLVPTAVKAQAIRGIEPKLFPEVSDLHDQGNSITD